MAKKVLLADDSVTIQKVVGISLANEDLELITVDNGIDAIERARALRPDLILSDVVMPGKSGYEVAEAIKSDPNLRHIPLLLLTQTFETFDAERAKRIGVDGHITKPFEAQTLVARVKAFLEAPPVAAPASPPAATQNDEYDFLGESEALVAEAVPETDGGFELATEADDDAAHTQFLDVPHSAPAPDQTVAMMPDELPTPIESSPAPSVQATAPRFSSSTTHPAQTIAIMDDMPLAADTGTDPLFFGETTNDGADASFDLLDDAAIEDEPAATTAPALQIDLSNPAATMLVSDAADDAFDLSFNPPAVEPRATPPEIATSETSFDDVLPADEPIAPPIVELGEAAYTEEGSFDLSAAEDYAEPIAEISAYEPELEAVAAEPLFDEPAPSTIETFEAPLAEATTFEMAEAESFADLEPEPQIARGAALQAATVSPEMRDQIHATIEKIAWEAMGDLSEQIVQQVVARVEAIAWEVIPQMAETLILEEIRRMKRDT